MAMRRKPAAISSTDLFVTLEPLICFASAANEERRRRAKALAKERGASMHAVATAWVLGQSFPSFALIGPRSPGEIASTLSSLTLTLSAEDCAWLTLERDDWPG